MDFFELNLGKVLSESSLTPLNFYFEDKMQYWKLRSEFVELQFRASPAFQPIISFDTKLKTFYQAKQKQDFAFVILKCEAEVFTFNPPSIVEIGSEKFTRDGLRIFLMEEGSILRFSEQHSLQYASSRLCIVSNKKPA